MGKWLRVTEEEKQEMLSELAATRRHLAPVREMTVRETFQLWGADEWDALRTRFRD